MLKYFRHFDWYWTISCSKIVFSDKEKIWIIEEGVMQKSAVVIKRKFVKHSTPHLFVWLKGLQKLLWELKKHFSRQSSQWKRSKNVNFWTAKDLQLFYQSVRRILNDLKMKPYKMWRCQKLTDQHRDQRMEFCRWFM